MRRRRRVNEMGVAEQRCEQAFKPRQRRKNNALENGAVVFFVKWDGERAALFLRLDVPHNHSLLWV